MRGRMGKWENGRLGEGEKGRMGEIPPLKGVRGMYLITNLKGIVIIRYKRTKCNLFCLKKE
jgi:hypothetical protein